MDQFFDKATVERPTGPARQRTEPDPDALTRIGALLAEASRPVLVLGTDVWADGAEEAALRVVEQTGLPAVTNGMGRGVVPGGHPLLVTKARGKALGNADLVVVVGTPLDFRLGYGVFGGKDGAPPARVVHLADSPGQVSGHVELAASASGDLTAVIDGVQAALETAATRPDWSAWVADLQGAVAAAVERDAELLRSEADPIHPARIYGELVPRLADDSVVIGDGGDFVSFAGRLVERDEPGLWIDPGPFGCLGSGPGYAIAAKLARPDRQVILLSGDGAFGFGAMEFDTMVRHRIPVVCVVGNNGIWALEKHPMLSMLGTSIAADLGNRTRYDKVVEALGGYGEMVERPQDIRPALERAFKSGVPACINVICDPEAEYPRSSVLM